MSILTGLTTLQSPPNAGASSLEKWLIMPGPVIQEHAETEEDCSACHDPLSDKPQHLLCVACHTEIGKDLTADSGFHGRLPRAEALECAECHTDHEGRDMDVVALDKASFDHDFTDFALRGKHRALGCVDCHAPGERHRDAPSACVDCHRGDDPHDGELGESCNSCHTSSDWTETTFDHDTTAFPLLGAHAATACEACHRSPTFKGAGQTCAACHREDDVHRGRNGEQCDDCHTSISWAQLTFDHGALTGFALVSGHAGLACSDCHQAADFRDRQNATCIDCHRGDDVHEGRNGDDCASCHAVSNWQKAPFDHAARTGFALPPGHQDLGCDACHVGHIEDALPRDCGGCHIDDDPHQGQLGRVCEACHEATTWTGRVWFDHDITQFPLLGVHADVGCDDCHANLAFHDSPTKCVACHADADPHGGSFGEQCDTCHNPAEWYAWRFDHDSQTRFALTGAHVGVACADCHATDAGRRGRATDACESCHRRDDPHSGTFGSNCGNCHTTDSFVDIVDL